jgi:hypothetical protein
MKDARHDRAFSCLRAAGVLAGPFDQDEGLPFLSWWNDELQAARIGL